MLKNAKPNREMVCDSWLPVVGKLSVLAANCRTSCDDHDQKKHSWKQSDFSFFFILLNKSPKFSQIRTWSSITSIVKAFSNIKHGLLIRFFNNISVFDRFKL